MKKKRYAITAFVVYDPKQKSNYSLSFVSLIKGQKKSKSALHSTDAFNVKKETTI